MLVLLCDRKSDQVLGTAMAAATGTHTVLLEPGFPTEGAVRMQRGEGEERGAGKGEGVHMICMATVTAPLAPHIHPAHRQVAAETYIASQKMRALTAREKATTLNNMTPRNQIRFNLK